MAIEGPIDCKLLERRPNELNIDGVPFTPVEPLPEDETVVSMLSALWKHKETYELQKELRAWTIYQNLRVDEDAVIRQSTVGRSESRVSGSGQNAIRVLKTLYENGCKEAIDNAMSAAFPDDYGELVFRPDRAEAVRDVRASKVSARADSAADLSDGTIRFLLMVAILATPDPPPLIAIDEPEAGLHPSMLPLIADLAVEASVRTQVILSTHSPEMLDAFGENLPSATVFEWTGDRTELKTIGGEELKKWTADYSLSRFIFSGEAAAVL